LVEDLAAFLRALRLAPAHLVGASNGAVVCLLLALTHRRLVRTLVLAEPPLLSLLGVSVPPRPSQILRLLVRDPRAAMAVVRFGATTIGPARRALERGDDEQGVQIFAAGVLGRQAAAILSDVMRQQSRDNVKAFKARLRAGFPPIGSDDVRRIHVPTLLVTGEHSAPILHRIGDTLQRLLPQAERHEIRHASHLMYETHAGAFNAAVLEFLARHAAMQA
jgi:pimeloyl-ACP methyl ester carboxylesterase